jgi:integrase
MTPAQLASFLATVRGDVLFVLWWLVALRGLRRGEVCGLRWVDVDLPGKTLTVCRQVTWSGGRDAHRPGQDPVRGTRGRAGLRHRGSAALAPQVSMSAAW